MYLTVYLILTRRQKTKALLGLPRNLVAQSNRKSDVWGICGSIFHVAQATVPGPKV